MTWISGAQMPPEYSVPGGGFLVGISMGEFQKSEERHNRERGWVTLEASKEIDRKEKQVKTK